MGQHWLVLFRKYGCKSAVILLYSMNGGAWRLTFLARTHKQICSLHKSTQVADFDFFSCRLWIFSGFSWRGGSVTLASSCLVFWFSSLLPFVFSACLVFSGSFSFEVLAMPPFPCRDFWLVVDRLLNSDNWKKRVKK